MSSELEVSIELAHAAGKLISESIGGNAKVDRKSAVNLVTAVDRAAEQAIVEGLRKAFPKDTVIAEEAADSGAGSRGNAGLKGRAWCIDPLDGTINFVHGLPHCAVSIALLEDGLPVTSVVYDPSREELFCAQRGRGAHLNEVPLAVSHSATLGEALIGTGFPYDRREHIDFYLEYFRAFITRARDLRRIGAAALDLCYVAAGRLDGFWEWKLQPWDTAAGWLIIEEAGGTVTDFDGAPYNPWLPRILATNGRFHSAAVEVFADLPTSP